MDQEIRSMIKSYHNLLNLIVVFHIEHCHTTINLFMKSFEANTASSKSKIVANLQAMLKQQIGKREQAEQSLLEYRARALRMESEFTRLLEKYSNDLAVANGRQSYSQDIWLKLVNQIEKFNDREENLLAKKCTQIEELMERRLASIIQRAEEDSERNKKFSSDEFRSAKQEIKSALNIAKQIEDQNEKLRIKITEMTFKNRILTQERRLLLQQICNKKLVIEKLIEKEKSSPNKVSKNSTKSISIQPVNFRSKNKSSPANNEAVVRFLGEPEEWFQNFGNKTNSSFRKAGSTARTVHSPNNNKAIKLQNSSIKTDEHMKICLQRERRRRMEYGAVVGQLQDMRNSIYELIQKGSSDPSKLLQQIARKVGRGNRAEAKGLNEQDWKEMGI